MYIIFRGYLPLIFIFIVKFSTKLKLRYAIDSINKKKKLDSWKVSKIRT